MDTKKFIVTNANRATAQIAYKTNEFCAIYPITPSSEMSELVADWSTEQKQNIYGGVPTVFEMQSEAGVAGALHGALQTGSLATTFTASQGLLLMMPNMYKIAGELTPNVIHVATRSVATHALSIFGDHSDIMAVRNTGYAFLGAASVQEAMDFALISQAASLESRIPFVHFFDGFRTSHETSKIEVVSDYVMNSMMNTRVIQAHRNRALNPNSPVIRGTAQGADVFFQSREAVNFYYNACPHIVQQQMDKFANLTGRQYRLFDYVGHPEAEQVIISMASSTETIEETIQHLNFEGAKIGLIKVRLFRPFSTDHLLKMLPQSCKAIAVLDRTKEPGATGEPLYLDIVQSLMSVRDTYATFPKIVGGRYGLSSKEFTPNMVKAIIENLEQEHPKNNFSIGITDDITNLSLSYSDDLHIQNQNYQVLFYETKSKSSVSSFQNALHLLAVGDQCVQGYTEIDYKKSGSRSISNLRISSHPIKAPHLIENADFIGCDSVEFLERDNVLDRIKPNGTLLVHTTLNNNDFRQSLSTKVQQRIYSNKIFLYTVNLNSISMNYVVEEFMVNGLQSCFLALNKDFSVDETLDLLKESIFKVEIFESNISNGSKSDDDFTNSFLGKLLAGKGNELPVSAFPVDGTYVTDTSKFTRDRTADTLPKWDLDACTQCGACSMACPQGAIRIKVYDDSYLSKVPSNLKATKAIEPEWEIDLLNYTLQINPNQCKSCNICIDACSVKALKMVDAASQCQIEKNNWDYFETIPEMDRSKIDVAKVSQQQLQKPLFKYSVSVDGCGEAPYLKLMSQLFGDRMLVANATGATSIFGGALPTTPWSRNKQGRGPAWANSLFEDNAEFGLGFRLSLDQQEQQAKGLIKKLDDQIDSDLVYEIMNAEQQTEPQITEQQKRIKRLKVHLATIASPDAQRLIMVADSLVKRSVWIVGGDGWAYDIGYGGLDHVLASGKNVNILVLDNEVYSNTGAQMSKATPLGAIAKFAAKGKQSQKKDLGLLAMCYDDVYVATVAMGADQEQTLKTFLEAESYDGPSLIIAYCHSPAHGIDMKQPKQYHKAAVASGQWLLYRNDPRRANNGENTLQLDCPEPTIAIEEYLQLERRFEKVFKTETQHFDEINQLQKQVNKRYQKYLAMTLPANILV
ncbi:4Fe-4S binding protein [Aurantibacter sp.]|uniref:4Fe-4S binding protein n=1 Tax=Aurantibacter sp. TaxID=2807103 RepID=UPI0032666F38